MKIEKLLKLLPIEGTAVETPTEKWFKEYEDSHGIIFPDSYKTFLRHYGSGMIGEFLTVWNPMATSKWVNFATQSKLHLKGFQMLNEEVSEFFQEQILFPAPGGLLPFAGTENADIIFWRTGRDPRKWNLVVSARSEEWCEFKPDLIGFLVGILKDSKCCSCMGCLSERKQIFKPAKLRKKRSVK